LTGRVIQRAALIFLPLAAVAIAVIYLLYATQVSTIRSIARATEDRVLDIARQRVVLTIGSMIDDVSYLAEQDALQEFVADGSVSARQHLGAEYVAFARHRAFYDKIRFLDTTGREIVRVTRRGDGTIYVVPDAELQDKTTRYFVTKALKLERGQVYVSPIDLSIEHGEIEQPPRPTVRAGVPVFDANGSRVGIIVVNYHAQRILDRVQVLAGDVAGIWVVNQDGEWLLGPSAEDAFAFMYPDSTRSSFAESHPAVWEEMQRSQPGDRIVTEAGSFAYLRGEIAGEQLGTTAAAMVDAPHWFVVIHTPIAFAAAQTEELTRNVIAAGALFLVLLAGISLGLARYQVHRRQTEQHIHLNEARFRAVTETAADAIISADRSGRIRYMNPAAERTFGYPEGEAMDQPLTILMPQRFHEGHTAGLIRYLETRQPKVIGKTIEIVARRRNGEEFPIDLALASSEVGNDFFFTAIIRDISARRAAELQIQDLNERLRADNAELAAVNKELEAFSYSVSHDLRAPLRAIDGFSQALIEDAGPSLTPEHHGHLNRVRQAAQRMGHLIDDLLKLARVTRAELKLSDVDLSTLARQIADNLQESAPDRSAEFIVTPGLKAEGDARLMQIVLENLLNNAWKFTAPRSPARIEFGHAVIDTKHAYYVRDNGVGFDMAHAGKMFGAFQRFHDTRDFAGTGIGLATVQRIINKHGGKIWARSEPGGGAVFFFTL
jgi:PAS domain S-box-containing protein